MSSRYQPNEHADRGVVDYEPPLKARQQPSPHFGDEHPLLNLPEELTEEQKDKARRVALKRAVDVKEALTFWQMLGVVP